MERQLAEQQWSHIATGYMAGLGASVWGEESFDGFGEKSSGEKKQKPVFGVKLGARSECRRGRLPTKSDWKQEVG